MPQKPFNALGVLMLSICVAAVKTQLHLNTADCAALDFTRRLTQPFLGKHKAQSPDISVRSHENHPLQIFTF